MDPIEPTQKGNKTMSVAVKVPGVGESVQEGMIETWHKQTGDYVSQDEVLLEIETDKATIEVVAEVSGVLTVEVKEGTVVKVGETIAHIEEKAQSETSSSSEKPQTQKTQEPKEEPEPKASTKNTAPLEPEGRKLSPEDNGPATYRMAQEHKIDLSGVSGTGRGGRVTKQDLQGLVKTQSSTPKSTSVVQSTPQASMKAGRMETREPMSMLRRRVSERLLAAQHNAAILTTFNEVDLSQVIELRKKYKEPFEKKYGVKLGFMSFFLKASCYALQKFPRVNAYIDGDDIVYHNYCDIGVAVSTPKGLLVPIIRDAETMTLGEIESAIANYATKARNNKISLDEIKGGTFTVSNGGVFGSLLSTPILNPPQSAILGMHKMEPRPVVTSDNKIEARPMMYLAVSYDHRIIDGKESVGFLVTIKECLEDPARLLIGV